MATSKFITNIIPTIAPRLPSATIQYDPKFQEQHSNVLRLYFNAVDTTFGGMLADTNTAAGTYPGGSYLAFPYAAIQRTTDKLFTSNTATQITFDQNDYLNACTNDGTDGIVVNRAGIYNYQFSVQFVNTDSQAHNAYVWLRKNGADIPATGSKYDVPSKHGASDGYLIATCNFFVDLQAGDYVSLYAAVAQAYVPATTPGVYMEAYAAQTSPFAMPAIPSVVATLSFVSRLPA